MVRYLTEKKRNIIIFENTKKNCYYMFEVAKKTTNLLIYTFRIYVTF